MSIRYRAGLILGLTLAYAILRYIIFHDVAWSNLPLYVLNKALSWTAIILFAMSLIASDKTQRRDYGVLAAGAILAHVIMSLMILNPHYFPKFFGETGRLSAMAEISMVAGVAGALLLAGLFSANLSGKGNTPGSLRAGWGRTILCCSALHVAAMGYAGWLAPGGWYGYLPPISLLSFLVALYGLYKRDRQT